MAGPWEKYQNAPKAAGPWEKYAEPKNTSEVKPSEDGPGLGEQLLRSTLDALPVAGAAVGGMVGAGAGLFGGPAAPISVPAGGVAGGAIGYAGGSELADLGKQYLLGDKPKANVVDQPLDVGARVAGNLRDGAMAEMGGQLAGKVIGKAGSAVSGARQKAAEKSKDLAERFAVNATGATGKQAEKFADGAGRQLLDRKLIKFGDNAEKIAMRTGDAADEAGKSIGDALKRLDAKGASASADDIVSELQGRIKDLSADSSQAPLAKKLQSIVDDIIETGNSNIPLSAAEKTKRGFQAKIKNWVDPEAGAANKIAQRAYLKEVEKKALAADPGLAAKFKEGKATSGLLAPIEEAASRRAAQLNQHPVGGLLDTAAAGVGTIASGGVGGLATGAASAAGRRVLAPRVSSSAAVTLDKISKILSSSPKAKELVARSPSVTAAISKLLSAKPEALSNAADNRGAQDGDSAIADIRGENKWAVDGLARVIEHADMDESSIEKVLSSKKGKALLVQASDLKPGSKAMDDVYSKIKKQLGDK